MEVINEDNLPTSGLPLKKHNTKRLKKSMPPAPPTNGMGPKP